ncbi:hypothetical protein M5D96_001043 [Drosophila gunungcola]|uniref:Uncharacterized protein n=1 Tax=Drosophila gunungcola TaxID=103775 RepID=A0A9P9YXF4_9MUSC|nr:hypothetical protein M5D96_001043 [Drosophila gunungcola]
MQLVETARQRSEMLVQQLRSAQLDYTNTKKAAYRAACAASEARQKAVRDRRSSGGNLKELPETNSKWWRSRTIRDRG